MASRFVNRFLLNVTKQTIYSALTRSYSSAPATSLSSLALRFRPLVAVPPSVHLLYPAAFTSVRGFATRRTSSSLKDPNPNRSNRPPKETIFLDGCDFEHWFVLMEEPEGDRSRDEIIDRYIKTLAQVVGSEEEARLKIYSVSTRHYFAFGALVSEELAHRIRRVLGVRWVLPDAYLDVKNKDYGGEPFINGQAVPYDPKYHEEWVRNNAPAKKRKRRTGRPRNIDGSGNFEKRQMANQNVQNTGAPGPNTGMPQQQSVGGMHPNNMGGLPNNAPDWPYGNGPNNGSMPNQSGSGTNYQPGPRPNQNSAPN